MSTRHPDLGDPDEAAMRHFKEVIKASPVPTLAPLDMHGVDDDGVYHPPSLTRYREWLAHDREMQTQITALQTLNTKLEDEKRKYKALAMASKALLDAACVAIPMSLMVTMDDGETQRAVVKVIQEVHERNQRLEADAWCGATNLLREFVPEAQAASSDHDPGQIAAVVRDWLPRMVEALKR